MLVHNVCTEDRIRLGVGAQAQVFINPNNDKIVVKEFFRPTSQHEAEKEAYFFNLFYGENNAWVDGGVDSKPRLHMSRISGIPLFQITHPKGQYTNMLENLRYSILNGELFNFKVSLEIHGIAHGDLNKANILFDPGSGRLLPIDFGLSAHISDLGHYIYKIGQDDRNLAEIRKQITGI